MLDFEKWLKEANLTYPYSKEDLKKAFYADREMQNPENIEYIKERQQIDIIKIAAALVKNSKR